MIGKFFASINLSDVAAMAGIPISFMTAYSISPEIEISFLEDIESGIMKVLKMYDVDFIGGDLKEGMDLILTGIAIGKQKKTLTRKRSDIGRKQMVAYTNKLGRAASGYIFYKSGYDSVEGINMMLGITPRLEEARIISEYGAKFMMDLSDGLYSSLNQMKADYGVGFKIVEDEVVYDDSARKAAEISGASVYDIACGYGGDYELLFTVPEENYRDFAQAMESNNIEVHFIGETWEGENIVFDGKTWTKMKDEGYEHFRPKPQLGEIR
nr:thiamine-phosphate kinase [Thermoplasma volcanium]